MPDCEGCNNSGTDACLNCSRNKSIKDNYVKTINVALTDNELRVLHALLWKVSGSSKNTDRKYVDSLNKKLGGFHNCDRTTRKNMSGDIVCN